MKRTLLLLGVGFLILWGCKSQIIYEPKPGNAPSDEAGLLGVIKETISQQPYSVTDLEVTPEYFKMVTSHRGSWWYGAGGGTRAVTVYYKNIGFHRFFQRNQWYYIEIFDKANVRKCHIATGDQEAAKAFLDALYSLKTKAEAS